MFRNSNKAMLRKARKIAETLAGKYIERGALGVVFLGALARGYFDEYADIDVIIIKSKKSKIPSEQKDYFNKKGFELDYCVVNYEDLLREKWSMEARWAYSQSIIYHDAKGVIKKLLKQKVPLKKSERKQLLIEGCAQSEWYVNELTKSWTLRGDTMSAHSMIHYGTEHFLNALFVLNGQLIPAGKWKFYCAQRLRWLPKNFAKKIKEVYKVETFSSAQLKKRRQAFMYLWNQLLPKVEREVGMKFSKALRDLFRECL